MCNCGAETEKNSHFFLRCQFFANEKQKLHDNAYWIDASIKNLNEESLTDVLLYGLDKYNESENEQILLCTMLYSVYLMF